jgi:hypothetical protein
VDPAAHEIAASGFARIHRKSQRLAIARQLDRAADVAGVLFAVVDSKLVIHRGDEIRNLDGRVLDEHAVVVRILGAP